MIDASVLGVALSGLSLLAIVGVAGALLGVGLSRHKGRHR